MKQGPPRPLLDAVTLTAVLATAGAAVLFWTPILMIWTALMAVRRHLPRRARSHGDLSVVA
jgi:hypothetical protein